MKVNFYYSLNVTNEVYAQGGYEEGVDLLQLCRTCAKQHADDVEWAQRGDELSICEFCEAANDLSYKAYIDAVMEEVRNG